MKMYVLWQEILKGCCWWETLAQFIKLVKFPCHSSFKKQVIWFWFLLDFPCLSDQCFSKFMDSADSLQVSLILRILSTKWSQLMNILGTNHGNITFGMFTIRNIWNLRLSQQCYAASTHKWIKASMFPWADCTQFADTCLRYGALDGI
jgi:hypothetical protein